ncbi:4-hydroxythreonine-4-phosphate dehydrogenase PdxA [Chondromyces crocatus]|uniref:4-hydroxythreonine-4-phosphate dehydrogenase n=1 Tax=Chondromyces crocatus TaxID=52 RepID=A0A0K1EQ05_CHOCO|nr:4-hydroxythreonine-4-phosphate dehydrogenase PdxA [Chondromyces crocatus]AKT43010.1 4-hydroxythreonine-4-phosphate dehydrogenase [Chondromyces crocatus]
MKAPIVAICVGCPSGVGPEVSVLAAARVSDARPLLVGDEAVIRRAATLRRVSQRRIVVVDRAGLSRLAPGTLGVWADSAKLPHPSAFGRPAKEDGAAQLAWIDQATDLVRDGLAQVLVTGPVSKLAIATSGAHGSVDFLGHTEHLARRLGAREVTMAFASAELVTALVTTHLSLASVPAAITPKEVARATFWLARLLRDLGRAKPRVAVAALNPHAGEGGLLGDEEQTRITPGIRLSRRRLLKADVEAEIVGPVGAETAFRLAANGAYDGVVAMYHDQATIPSKLLGFGEAVNVTLGLPIVRTSVDHGTAHDVAGTGRADARGMREAIALAVRLAR